MGYLANSCTELWQGRQGGEWGYGVVGRSNVLLSEERRCIYRKKSVRVDACKWNRFDFWNSCKYLQKFVNV